MRVSSPSAAIYGCKKNKNKNLRLFVIGEKHTHGPAGRKSANPMHTLNVLDQAKANSYTLQLDLFCSAELVRCGMRVIYHICSFTGASHGQVDHGVAGHLKKVETLRSIPRDDGFLPQQVAGLPLPDSRHDPGCDTHGECPRCAHCGALDVRLRFFVSLV